MQSSTVQIDRDLHRKLKIAAAKRDTTIRDLVASILKEKLDE